jgi:hypothetical protein
VAKEIFKKNELQIIFLSHKYFCKTLERKRIEVATISIKAFRVDPRMLHIATIAARNVEELSTSMFLPELAATIAC